MLFWGEGELLFPMLFHLNHRCKLLSRSDYCELGNCNMCSDKMLTAFFTSTRVLALRRVNLEINFMKQSLQSSSTTTTTQDPPNLIHLFFLFFSHPPPPPPPPSPHPTNSPWPFNQAERVDKVLDKRRSILHLGNQLTFKRGNCPLTKMFRPCTPRGLAGVVWGERVVGSK